MLNHKIAEALLLFFKKSANDFVKIKNDWYDKVQKGKN